MLTAPGVGVSQRYDLSERGAVAERLGRGLQSPLHQERCLQDSWDLQGFSRALALLGLARHPPY